MPDVFDEIVQRALGGGSAGGVALDASGGDPFEGIVQGALNKYKVAKEGSLWDFAMNEALRKDPIDFEEFAPTAGSKVQGIDTPEQAKEMAYLKRFNAWRDSIREQIPGYKESPEDLAQFKQAYEHFSQRKKEYGKITTLAEYLAKNPGRTQGAFGENIPQSVARLTEQQRGFLAQEVERIGGAEAKEGFFAKFGEAFSRGVIGAGQSFEKLGAAVGGTKEQEKALNAFADASDQAMGKSPVAGKDANWVQRGFYSAVQMAPNIAASIASGVGTGGAGPIAYWWVQGATEINDSMRQHGVGEAYSKPIAALAAIPYAAIEMLQVKQLAPGLVAGARDVVARSVADALKKVGIGAAKTYGMEMSEEAVQGVIKQTSKAMGAYLDEKAPDINWKQDLDRFTAEMGEAAISMPFLMGPGAAVQGAQDVGTARWRGQVETFAKSNPQAAALIAGQEAPSRRLFEKLNIEGRQKMDAAQRASFAEELRRQGVGQQAQPADGITATPAPMEAVPEAPEAPTAVEQPVPAQQPAPTEIAPQAPTVQAQPAAQEQAAPLTEADLAQMSPGEIIRKVPETDKPAKTMTRVEATAEIYRSQVPGMVVPNGRAYREARTAKPDAPHVKMDGDALKYVNDNYGHEAGNILLRGIGQALHNEGLDGFHISGDEFGVVPTSEADVEKVKRAQEQIQKSVFTYELPDGRLFEHTGAGFSFGVGATDAEAESNLQQQKLEREQAGTRAKRGERPQGLVDVAPAGRKDEAGDAQRTGNPPAAAQEAPATEDLSSLSREELFKRAKALDPAVKSGMAKSKLIQKIQQGAKPKEESNVRRRLRKPDDEGAHEGQPKAKREKETQAEIPLPKKGQKVKFNPQDALEPNRQRKALHGVVKTIETANGKQFAVVAADGRTWTVPIEKAGRFQGEALRENEQQRIEQEYTPKQVKWIEKASSDSRILASRYVAPIEAEIREKHILDPQKPLTAAANAELQDKLDSFMRQNLGMKGSGHDAQAKALPFVLEAVMDEAEKGTVLPKLKSVEFVGAVSEGDTITLGARKWKAVKEAEGGRLTLKAENGDEIQFYRNYVPIDKGTKRRRGERKAAMRKGEPRPEVKPDVKVEPETQAKVVNETDLLGQERARVEGAGGAVEQGQMFDNEVSAELARERRLKQAHREAGGKEFEFEESDEDLELPEKPDDDIPFYDADKDPFSGSVQMEPGAKPIGNHEIIATMERLFGVLIKVGRVAGRPAGFYMLHDWLVRMKGKFAGDLGVATHEVAHHIDNMTGLRKAVPRHLRKELAALDYDPKKKRVHEGWAEFIRHLLTEDDAKQVAPNFYTWFQDEWLPSHPHFAQRLATTKDYINRWRAQGAEARVKAGISKTGKPAEALNVGFFARAKEKIGAFIDRQTAAWVNDIHYTTLYERLAREQGYDPKEGDSPSEYIAAMSQAGPALATTAVLHGVFNVSATNMDKIGPSLKEAFEDIDREEYETFVSWMYARHARESWAKGKNPGISKVDADYVYEKYKDNARYKKAADTLTAFNNALVDMLANAGVIKHESAERMRKFYETYIPLMRVKDTLKGQRGLGSKNLLNLGSPVFGRKGSGLQVIDPVVATMERAVRFYTRATQQVAIEKIVNVARKTPGMGGWATKVAPHMVKTQFSAAEAVKQLEALGVEFNEEEISDEVLESMLDIYKPLYQGKESEGIARIIGKDKTELWQFDKDLYRSVAGMNYLELPAFLEMTLGAGTRAVRLGATGINLIFGQMNVVRDYPAYLIQEKHQKGVGKLISPFVATASYIQSEVQRLRGKDENPHVQLWKEFGGPLSTILGLDRKQLAREIDSLMAKTATGRVLDASKHPVDLVRDIISISEVGPRLAEFKAVMEAHGYDAARLARMRKIGARPPTHIIIEAMNAAHEVTINFKRSGYYGRYVNRMSAYFNPAIQGISKYARTWKDMPKRTTLYASMLATAGLLYYMVKKDEDWYREAPPWLKYGFWTISDDDGKPIARIPRSFEWGWTIASGAEAIADAIYRKDPKEFERYTGELLQRQIPNMKPSLITPALEVFFNFDLFRDAPIVGPDLQNRKPEDQYRPETTELMKAIGKLLGMSPAKLEHLAEQTTGGLFGRAERGAEGLITKGEMPKEILGVGAFDLKRDYSQSTSEFYAKRNELEQAYNSAKDKGQDTPKQKAEHKRMEEFAGIMSDLRADIKDEKDRDKRFEHEKYIIGLSRFALGKDALDRYPNPLGADSKDLPPAVAAIRDEYLGRLTYRLTTPRPERKKGEPLAEFQERKAEYEREFEEAQDFISEIDLDRQEMFRLLQIEAKRRGYKTNLWVGNRRSSYGERLLRLRRATSK